MCIAVNVYGGLVSEFSEEGIFKNNTKNCKKLPVFYHKI